MCAFVMLDQTSRVFPTRNFVVYRASADPADPYDACAPLEFFPERDSDELFEALKEAFPHVRTHKERVREAVIEYLLMEKEELRKQAESVTPSSQTGFDFAMFPAGSTSTFADATSPNLLGSMDMFPQQTAGMASLAADTFDIDLSLSSSSDDFLSSPDSLLTFATPDMTPLMPAPFDSFSPDEVSQSSAQESPVATAASSGETPAMEQFTTVWSISNDPQPKRRSRRTMTEDEKKAYRKKRIAGACAECRRKRRKCQHTAAEAGRPDASAHARLRAKAKECRREGSPAFRLDHAVPGGTSDLFSSLEPLHASTDDPWPIERTVSDDEMDWQDKYLHATPPSTTSEASSASADPGEFNLQSDANKKKRATMLHSRSSNHDTLVNGQVAPTVEPLAPNRPATVTRSSRLESPSLPPRPSGSLHPPSESLSPPQPQPLSSASRKSRSVRSSPLDRARLPSIPSAPPGALYATPSPRPAATQLVVSAADIPAGSSSALPQTVAEKAQQTRALPTTTARGGVARNVKPRERSDSPTLTRRVIAANPAPAPPAPAPRAVTVIANLPAASATAAAPSSAAPKPSVSATAGPVLQSAASSALRRRASKDVSSAAPVIQPVAARSGTEKRLPATESSSSPTRSLRSIAAKSVSTLSARNVAKKSLSSALTVRDTGKSGKQPGPSSPSALIKRDAKSSLSKHDAMSAANMYVAVMAMLSAMRDVLGPQHGTGKLPSTAVSRACRAVSAQSTSRFPWSSKMRSVAPV